MSDTILQVNNVSKYYKLGQFNNGTLIKDIQSWYALKRGKEDPNAKLDAIGRQVCNEGFWALKDIDIDIKQGDRVGIIGKNGAGKSTLLKIISQITAPTTGEIKIKGRVASLLEVGTGFHPEMTGRENIYLNGAILGMKRSEIDRKLDEIIDFSEIEEHIDTPVKRYSSGMYVRLAFAVAAHLDSEILIADEVLAVGDAAFQKKALGKMNDISTGQGRTVLFVSHNMSAVRGLCNTGILLDRGKITQSGNLNDVIDSYFDNPFLHTQETIEEKISKLPLDKSFRFLKIKVMQNGKTIGTNIGNASSVEIELYYEVLRKEVGFRVLFDICDSSGELLLRSFNDEQNDGMSVVSPGKYVSKTSIPANFLGPTNYILMIHSTIHNVRNCSGDGIKIPLSVFQDGIYNRAYPNDTFRGKFGYALPWSTEQIE